MAATDVLKNFRDKGYNSTKPDDSKQAGPDENKPESPRVLALTDDEQKTFANSKPGEDLACEVHGTMDGSGGFRVMSIGPLGRGPGAGMDENMMAGQVAQRVMPNIAPSPS